MKAERYLYRRQFIISPQKINGFHHWHHSGLPDGSYVYVHPDLYCMVARRENDFIALMGYILDPFNASRNNAQIIADMLKSSKSIDDLFRYLEPLGGRFSIIAGLGNKKIMVCDPAGFRQIFYMRDSIGEVWVASQPSLLSEMFSLKVDETLERDLYSIPLFANTHEYWYPGELSAYSGVKHLIPNHYLDLKLLKQVRYWPKEKLSEESVEDCVEKCSEILHGLYNSIQRRYKLAQGITAGLDSRIILAASREIGSKIEYLTHTHAGLGLSGADIMIPSKMLPELGLEHKIVVHYEIMDKEFERIYRRNVSTARYGHGLNAYAFHRYFSEQGKERILINGVCGEITRGFYYLPSLIPVNGVTLCSLTRMRGSRIALEQFESWLQNTREVSRESGVSLLDLFYWEQRVGSWAAMTYHEYDIAFESFSPMNCRLFLSTMLGVKKNYRQTVDTFLHKALIKRMWPEALKYVINPPKKMGGKLIRKMKRTPLHGIIKTIKYLRYSGF